MWDKRYYQGEVLKTIRNRIHTLAEKLPQPITLMEVCGTHTHVMGEFAIRRSLPPKIRIVSGPGCPVCVTPVDYLDHALALGKREDILLATYGDLLQVPSSTLSLEEAKSQGVKVEVVYSAEEALQLAMKNPKLKVVFLSVGFETTIPATAVVLQKVEKTKIRNFFILSGGKRVPPALVALAQDPALKIHGFLLPGHVSVITGWKVYTFLADTYHRSAVVVGFTPADILWGIERLLIHILRGKPVVENLYTRAVTPHGNTHAQALIQHYFEPVASVWRGIGQIPDSGLKLRDAFSHLDACQFPVSLPPPKEPPGCRCGDVLKGLITPPECPLFAEPCYPDHPVGACMVSSEGSCAAYYKHERF